MWLVRARIAAARGARPAGKPNEKTSRSGGKRASGLGGTNGDERASPRRFSPQKQRSQNCGSCGAASERLTTGVCENRETMGRAKHMLGCTSSPSAVPTPSTKRSQRGQIEPTTVPSEAAAALQSRLSALACALESHTAPHGSLNRSAANTFQ
eukprot:6817387-Prymnesium_polylepis.2